MLNDQWRIISGKRVQGKVSGKSNAFTRVLFEPEAGDWNHGDRQSAGFAKKHCT
ncbi:hypothetical protein SDC9_163385 [bioreactor metagenome]|uniref:Uncharacterized protein n=1 Tax=bioreactor metagenome TaxID=1076179 RepID=A0A645FNP2_9ZZZZ